MATLLAPLQGRKPNEDEFKLLHGDSQLIIAAGRCVVEPQELGSQNGGRYYYNGYLTNMSHGACQRHHGYNVDCYLLPTRQEPGTHAEAET